MNEPIIAYRAWKVERDGLLKPIGWTTNVSAWKPLEPEHAVCKSNSRTADEAEHKAPQKDCRCGLYAFKQIEDLIQIAASPRLVLGRVAIWGRIVELEKGYRAEYAYPQVLYTGGQYPYASRWAVERAARRYGVDVDVASDDALDLMWDKSGGYLVDAAVSVVAQIHEALKRDIQEAVYHAQRGQAPQHARPDRPILGCQDPRCPICRLMPSNGLGWL